jgi:hypothetical protein
MGKFIRQPPNSPEGVTWIAGGEVDEYHISLGFSGDDLDPDDISSRLGGIPTLKCAKGDVTLTNGVSRVERTGRWLVSVPPLPGESLEPQLERLLAGLAQDISIWQAIAERYKVRFVVSAWIRSWNRGFEVSPALLRKLADRGLSLGIDIYVDYEKDGV